MGMQKINGILRIVLAIAVVAFGIYTPDLKANGLNDSGVSRAKFGADSFSDVWEQEAQTKALMEVAGADLSTGAGKALGGGSSLAACGYMLNSATKMRNVAPKAQMIGSAVLAACMVVGLGVVASGLNDISDISIDSYMGLGRSQDALAVYLRDSADVSSGDAEEIAQLVYGDGYDLGPALIAFGYTTKIPLTTTSPLTFDKLSPEVQELIKRHNHAVAGN